MACLKGNCGERSPKGLVTFVWQIRSQVRSCHVHILASMATFYVDSSNPPF